MNEAFELSVRGRHFRIQPPETDQPRAILLAVHGFTGDETSMEIFTRKLRRVFWVIYPRAPYPMADSGYSWVNAPRGIRQTAADFIQEAHELNFCLDLLSTDLGTLQLPVFSMGFSQGAALALVFSCLFSKPYDRHGLLSGFLPEGLLAKTDCLQKRLYFVAHGNRDAIVPVENSHHIVKFLQDSGAGVQYCASNTAHKLGLECLRSLEDFFLGDSPELTPLGK